MRSKHSSADQWVCRTKTQPVLVLYGSTITNTMNNPWRGRRGTLEQRSILVDTEEFGSSSIVFKRDGIIKGEDRSNKKRLCRWHARKHPSTYWINFNIPCPQWLQSARVTFQLAEIEKRLVFPHNLMMRKCFCFCFICSASSFVSQHWDRGCRGGCGSWSRQCDGAGFVWLELAKFYSGLKISLVIQDVCNARPIRWSGFRRSLDSGWSVSRKRNVWNSASSLADNFDERSRSEHVVLLLFTVKGFS